MSKALKIILILLIIGIAGAIVYLLMFSNVEPSTTTSPLETTTGQSVSGLTAQTTQDVDADRIGQEFLAQLLNIKAIKLREDIFTSPTFISLRDFTIELIQQGNEGRINPFAPFGAESVDTEISGDGSLGVPGLGAFGPGSVTPVNPSPPQVNTNNS